MMQTFPPTVVIRHRKENLKKCSLRTIESRQDFHFFSYPYVELPKLPCHLLLTLDAPPLTEKDSQCGLIIIDATWRYAAKMLPQVESLCTVKRSLPDHFRTAYPRRQLDCFDPSRGLASIEAIFLAYKILGRETEGLLDGYYWKELFLHKNHLL